jgi:hypothetical protein
MIDDEWCRVLMMVREIFFGVSDVSDVVSSVDDGERNFFW